MSPELRLPPLCFSVTMACQLPWLSQRACTALPSTSMWFPLPDRVFKKMVSPDCILAPVAVVVVVAVVVNVVTLEVAVVVDVVEVVELARHFERRLLSA